MCGWVAGREGILHTHALAHTHMYMYMQDVEAAYTVMRFALLNETTADKKLNDIDEEDEDGDDDEDVPSIESQPVLCHIDFYDSQKLMNHLKANELCPAKTYL